METTEKDFSHINGWGIDADPEKKYTGDDHKRINWERPPLQPVTVEVLHSNERPSLSAVFGTASPPKGLSGAIRRYAFKYSESSYGHWLPLLLADRVNVVEGIVDDLKQGHVPNIFAEKGWAAEWKYNRKAVLQKAATAAIVTFVVLVSLNKKKKQ
jgi:hypothetical protein